MRQERLFVRLGVTLAIAVLVAACTTTSEETTSETGAESAAAGDESVYTCDDPLGCTDVAPGDPVRIGSLFVLSGPNESLGVDSRNGVEIAIDDFGTIAGHAVELAPEDSQCSAEGGQAAASKLAADETIAGVIGTSCSSAAEPAIPIISEAGLVMISPSNTAPPLTAADRPAKYAGYLRTAHNDRFQGRVAAEFAFNELGVKKAATIHDGSPYAEQLQQVFADVFGELGGEITSQQAINIGDTDMRPVLTTIAADSPEIIYYPIFVAEGGFVTTQAREVSGLEDTVLMGADGLFSPDFVKAAGSAALNMYLTGPFVSGAAYDAFLAKHQEKYGSGPPSGFHAHAYDATTILLTGIAAVVQDDPDGTLHIPHQAMRDAVFSTAGYKGLTGTLTCQGPGSDNPGDCATGEALAVFQISQEVLDDPEGAWPPEVAWQPGQ